MRSPLATLFNKAPVPYVGRGAVTIPWRTPTGAEAQMRALGHVSTLFAIVHRLSNATAQVEWALFQKAAEDERPEDRTRIDRHAALDLINKPNAFYSRQEFFETTQQHLDLTGEGWWIIARNRRAKLPLELWPVRPDRMAPVPDPEEFLTGYTYTTPDGTQIDLDVDEVIQIKMPNPLDPYRGMGPVQTLLTDLDATKYSAEWNRNFFLNSAEPGGIIQVDKRLSDAEFDEMAERWAEQHKGVANAHRVAIIEQGQWIDRKYTNRDMQFTELRDLSREIIREAFGFPKPLLGTVDDANRANMEAAEVIFARWLIVPRLERFKRILNARLLPLYGPSTKGLEFDYVNPVPDDREMDAKELTAQANAAAALVTAGFDAAAVLEAVGLPEMDFAAPAPPPPPVMHPASAAPEPAPAARLDIHHHALAGQMAGASVFDLGRRRAIRAAADENPDDLPDVTHVLTALDAQLDELMTQWDGITAEQKAALVDAVRRVAETGAITDLAAITVPTAAASAALAAAMTALAATAADQAVTEAAAQGVTLEAATVSAETVQQVADVVAGLLADELKVSAVRAALAANGPDVPAETITTAVTEHLDDLSNANARKQLGGALHGSMNAARINTMRTGPAGALYANEKNDHRTCPPCRAVNGTWLGNTDDMAMVEKSYPAGAFGGYVHCEGGVNCRGTVTGVWRPKQTGGGQ